MAQVRNLRPGRRYAYRIVIKPDVVPPWADPPEQPPSAAEIYETPATVPMPPKPIKCTRRERAAFEVCVPLCTLDPPCCLALCSMLCSTGHHMLEGG